MITISQKARTIMHVVAAVLWVFMLISAACVKADIMNLFGLYACTIVTVIYFILGTTINGKIGSTVPLFYPIILMGIFWIIGFTIAVLTKGQKLDLIMGFHPGVFGATIFFWIGTLITNAIGYFVFFDKYLLTEEKWDTFMKEVAQNQKAH